MTNLIAMLHTTAAYQAAILQLMVAEANFTAKQLNLRDTIPSQTNLLADWSVSPPPLGAGGHVGTSNYTFNFEQGRLTSISKRDWLSKVEPVATNLLDLAHRFSRLDTNSVLDFTTQALARLNIDLGGLNQLPVHVFQIPARRTDEHGRNLRGASNIVATPLFQISWGPRPAPMDAFNPVFVKILGTTPEIVDLRIRERKFSERAPLVVTNAAALLGPLPPPRHFIEELFGGVVAYETVASPTRVEAWLLNSQFHDDNSKQPETRLGLIRVPPKLATQFAKTLLNFDTYHWGIAKACLPDYGMKLRFIKSMNAVDVRFCFECDILEITSHGRTRIENFDFNHSELVSIAKKLFPKDEKIQELDNKVPKLSPFE